MPKTLTIDDAIQTATTRCAAIKGELSNLDAQRGELGLDVQLGVAGAEGKLRALSEKVRALHQERDDLEAAIAAASRRQADEAKRAAEAEKQRAVAQNKKLTAERAAVYDSIAETLKELAALSVKAVEYDRAIDLTRQRIDPAAREHPLRQSVARIKDALNTTMCEAGFQRDFEWPHPSRRVTNPRDWQ